MARLLWVLGINTLEGSNLLRVISPAVLLPQRVQETQPFWDACRRGKLLLSRCSACGERYFCSEGACPRCHSADWDWMEATGKGILYSYVICYRSKAEATKEIPYIIAIIQLDDGPRIMSNLTGLERVSDGPSVGMRVEVVFDTMKGQECHFSFRPTL